MERLRHEAPVRGLQEMERLRKFPVGLYGLGAIGSNLAFNLSKMGLENLTLFDFDRVETHNSGTQVYDERHIKMLKTDAMESVIYDISRNSVSKVSQRVTESNIMKLSQGVDLLIDGFDNSKSREVLFNYSKKSGKPCVHCGFNGSYAEIRWNERYIVPSGEGEDICEYPLLRNLVTLSISVLAEVIVQFILTGKKENYSITFNDLKIHRD